MAEVLRRYKLFIIFLGLIILAAFIWFVISRPDYNKIPSRGVFVYSKHSSKVTIGFHSEQENPLRFYVVSEVDFLDLKGR